MSKKIRIRCVILCFLCCVACKPKPEPGNTPLSSLDLDLSTMNWIIGTWQSEDGSNYAFQVWEKQNDSVFIANNIVVVDPDTIFNHSIKIQPVDNKIILEIIPNNEYEEPEKYLMIVNKNGEHVFENKMKDFPQRIIFVFNTDGSLYYRLEGSIEGQAQYQDFNLNKTEKDPEL
ncbi:MAG: hypothetical protein JXB49_34700 [Bacteroidales bacterium]|nr:hypothetical protein [Bacteroidales bacterium]